MATHHDHAHQSDKGAAFTGLVLAVIAIAAIVYGIVQLTNRAFAGHQPAAATQQQH